MKILQRHIQQADFARTVHAVTPEPGTTLDQVLKPEAWAHVAKLLKAGDKIEVRSADGEWFAELYVRSVTETDAHVVVLQSYKFSGEKPAPTEVDVKFRGDKKWSVIRKADKAVLTEGLETKGAAEDWAKANQLG